MHTFLINFFPMLMTAFLIIAKNVRIIIVFWMTLSVFSTHTKQNTRKTQTTLQCYEDEDNHRNIYKRISE